MRFSAPTFCGVNAALPSSAEWFLGPDPGPGSAIAVSGLAPGNHRIGLRFRDTDGLWLDASRRHRELRF